MELQGQEREGPGTLGVTDIDSGPRMVKDG